MKTFDFLGLWQKILNADFRNKRKQAGAELCQAQFKFRLEVLLKP